MTTNDVHAAAANNSEIRMTPIYEMFLMYSKP